MTHIRNLNNKYANEIYERSSITGNNEHTKDVIIQQNNVTLEMNINLNIYNDCFCLSK